MTSQNNNGESGYQTRYDIYAGIGKATIERNGISNIMKDVGLNYAQAEGHIENLLLFGLLKGSEGGPYIITNKGRRYLEVYTLMTDLLNPGYHVNLEPSEKSRLLDKFKVIQSRKKLYNNIEKNNGKNGKKIRQTRYDIYAKFAEVCLYGGASKFKLRFAINSSQDHTKKNIDYALSIGLLEQKGKTFHITNKGRRYLEVYTLMTDLLNPGYHVNLEPSEKSRLLDKFKKQPEPEIQPIQPQIMPINDKNTMFDENDLKLPNPLKN
jgi:predicted transcriptional regulator